ncbi:YqhR family membrane protein [Bacillus massiliglaciei]|uniref:YqhR family membrane protein n=1 Tax=Bacillus massiliglaciei TaxID=1816693 RepID=UPI000DA63F20|nr:YqhR family membrane protein [Bacillus massiliglaciei]
MQNHPKSAHSSGGVLLHSAVTGFTGGALACIAALLAKYFNLMEFTPLFLLTSWSDLNWIDRWQGKAAVILLSGILSVLLALFYYLLMKRIKSMFGGLFFGIICWLLVMYALNPMFSDLPAVQEMSKNSIITSICIFLLYGVFTGFSISFDYHEFHRPEERLHESER